MHNRFIFCMGVALKDEFEVSENLLLRPVRIEASHIALENYVSTQRDYGILCALADRVTCELEFRAETDKEAAIGCWNHQWLIVLLSIILRAPIYTPIHSFKSAKALSAKCCYLSNIHISSLVFNTQTECNIEQLRELRALYPSFYKLIDNQAFQHAAAIAANNYNEPRKSIRMAAIWSGIEALLNIEVELSYRIPMICALLINSGKDNRLAKFRDVQKLYNARSKCVHGTGIKSEELDYALKQSASLLRDLLYLFCKAGKLPTQKEIKELPFI